MKLDFFDICFWIWVVSWFSAIWIKQISYELFLTGLFAFFLALFNVGEKTHETKK